MGSVGWDISTSIAGIALIESGSLVWKDHIDLRKKEHLNDKAILIEEYIEKNIGPGHTHFLEDRLGNFSGGKTSMQTLMRLAAFNAMSSFIIEKKLGIRPHQIHPVTVKAILKKFGLIIPKGQNKKELTLAWVRKREPGFSVDLNRNDNVQTWAYDEADAYCIALAGEIKYRSGA